MDNIALRLAAAFFSVSMAARLAVGNEFPPMEPANIPEDPFSYVFYTYCGEAGFTDKDLERSGSEVDMHEVEGRLSAPLITGEKRLLLLGLAGKWNRFEFKNMSFGDIPAMPPELQHVTLKEQNLYTALVPVDFIYTGIEKWLFYVNVQPGLFTDFDRIDNHDFKVQFHGMISYDWTAWLAPALGVGYDTAFGDDTLYPLGGVVWKISKQWQVRALYPMPQVLYAPTRKLLFYADARPSGDKWNMRLKDVDGEFDFKLETIRIGAGVEYGFTEHLWLHLGAGVDVERNYEISDGDRSYFNSGVEDTWFARAGLLVR